MEQKALNALEKFGLSEKEAKIYLSCLELGTSPAYDISIKADLPRTLTYDILDRLMELKLVQLIYQEKKKFFRAAAPSTFDEILKEKKQAIGGVMDVLKRLQLENPERRKPHVHLFEGKEGIKTIYEDVLKSNIKEYIAIGGSGIGKKILPYFQANFYQRKAKLKINLKLIFRDTKEARERAKVLAGYGYVEVRFIPKNYVTPISVYAYGDKTAILMWSHISPLAFRIDSKHITEGFQSYIRALWDQGKK
ncbi:MAG: hypothetical protein KJ601_08250 [Nanoarchaeota archaeon]|nr:hypothetical protein [Nanoarchaeota archaeon]MBU1704294.1 hypothetical protein [Nanoarchaeota archaeon]